MKFDLLFGVLLVASPAMAADGAKPVTIQLSTKGNDITFDQSSIEIPLAKAMTIRFENRAALDSQIQHNIAILKPGSMDVVIADLQAAGYDLEKLKKNSNIIAMTMALDPGKTEELSFSVPGPGFYPYICLMPGHGDMLGMKGLMHIKQR